MSRNQGHSAGCGEAIAELPTFNGVAAKFRSSSDTFVIATVPAGATSGPVEATTPSGVLVSNTNFQVK